MKKTKKNYYLIVLIIGILTTIALSMLFTHTYRENEKAEVQHTLEIYTDRTENLLYSLFHKTDILESIIITSKGEVPEETFNDLAKSLMQGEGIRAIQYLPNGVVQYCYPIQSNEKAVGENIFENPERREDALLAKNTKEIALSSPYMLTQGGFGLVARNPIFLTQEDGTEVFWGFSVIILDLPEALNSLVLEELEHNGYKYSLYTSVNNEKVIIKESENFDEVNSLNGDIEVPNHIWKLALSRKSHLSYYLNIALILGFGIGITILCTIIAHMLEERHEQLINHAEIDSLTGLVNRRKLLNYLELRCRNEKNAMALLYVDINDFKKINDTYGHLQGDVLLKEAGCRMKQCIASEDVIARIGGDEFVIILEHLERKADCKEKMKDLSTALNEPIKLDKAVIRMTASIGYAFFPEEAIDSEGLIHLADKRMYHAKKNNK